MEVPTGTPEPRCNDFDLRLTNTSFTTQDVFVVYEGNVEICFNGSYVAICDLGWDNVEAQLACNIVGYGEPLFRKLGALVKELNLYCFAVFQVALL